MTDLVASLEKATTAPYWLLPATQNAFGGPTAEASKPEFMSCLGRVLNEDPVSIVYAMKGILLGREDLHPAARLIVRVPVLILASRRIASLRSPKVKVSPGRSATAASSSCPKPVTCRRARVRASSMPRSLRCPRQHEACSLVCPSSLPPGWTDEALS